MVKFEQVSKRFQNGYSALDNVSFHLCCGEMAFLTGHSGAGKSTLLKIIMKMEDITRGQVLVSGKNLAKLPQRDTPRYRRSIGMIFQNPLLLAKKTIFENVALPLVISGATRQEISRRARAALDKVGLLDKEKYYPPALSAGEQQRVGIARAVVNRPTLLLADEPTGNLDPQLSNEIMHLLDEFNQIGATILVATHDLALIAAMKHRIFTLKNGHLS
jgi:cell division transport system ATP-binding protein